MGACRRDAIDPHRAGDVFQFLFAEIVEGEVEPARRVLLHPRRDANPAGLGQGFEPGGDVDPVAENVAVLDDDIADIDADAEFDPFRSGDPGIAPGHRLLPFARAAQGVDHAGELDEEAVAGGLDQPAAMLGDPSGR